MKKFWIVCNFESSHWKMSDTYRYKTKKEALEYAKTLCNSYQNTYYVLRAETVIKPKSAPITVRTLK